MITKVLLYSFALVIAIPGGVIAMEDETAQKDKAMLLERMINDHQIEKCGDFWTKYYASAPNDDRESLKAEFFAYRACSKPYRDNGFNAAGFIKELEREAYNEGCKDLDKKEEQAIKQYFNAMLHKRPLDFVEQLRARMVTAGQNLEACRKEYKQSYVLKKIKEELTRIENFEQNWPQEHVLETKQRDCSYLARKWMLLYEYDRFSKKEESQATRDAYKALENCGWLYAPFIKAIEKK